MRNEQIGASATSAQASGEAVLEKARKVAAITVSFWVLKVLVTTVGDLSGDALSISLGLGYVLALIVALAVFVPLLLAQLRSRRFIAWLYWLVILSSSAVGAEISDGVDRALHWGDLRGTVLFLICLLVAVITWFVHRGTLCADPIEQPDERYYWLAVVLANCLGSALGDLVGDKSGLGVLGGTAFNVGVVVLLLVLRYTTRVNKGALFWSAFVVTRIPF